jgi:ornithine cyclodeaminase
MNNTVVNTLVANDMKKVINDVENCLSLFDKGDAINTGKLVTCKGDTPEDENIYGRINAMPGFIGGEYNVLGIKWIGSGPSNLKIGLPRASVTVVLNDADTKLPIAIADGTTVSAKRTGAVGGIAIKYLAKNNAKTMLICGAGAQGRTQLEAALVECPTLNKVYIYDLYFDRSEQFAKEMNEKHGIEVIPVKNIKDAAEDSDIIVTVTLATEPFIEYEWLKKGALVMNMADYEVSYDCVSKADLIVCDTWEGIKHRMISTVALMYKEGIIKDEDIDAELGEIINKKKSGRENDDQIIYFNAVGMGIEDITVVAHAYRLAKEKGLGVNVNYWE